MSAPSSQPDFMNYLQDLEGDNDDDWMHPSALYAPFYLELGEQSILDPCPPEDSHSGSQDLSVVNASINESARQTSYCGFSRDGHDLDRRDAFYVPTLEGPSGTIFVAIWSEVKSLGQRLQTGPGEPKISEDTANLTGQTLFLYSRICFPIPKSAVGKHDSSMWPRATRDLAAKAIDARLDLLEESRRALSVFLANLSRKNFNNITQNDPLRLSQGLNTMLRDTRFTFDDQPATTFALRKNVPEVSTRCRITVGGKDHLITFRRGVTTADCWDANKLPDFGLWEDGKVCPLSSIVDTSSNELKLLPGTASQLFNNVSTTSDPLHPPFRLDSCIMGNNILCRAKVGEDTAESTSSPAN